MNNNKIICTSFPRSGHHMLEGTLKEAIGIENFHYCEVYRHCKTIPCPEKKTNYQKSHDFKLEDPILPDRKYIIQFRHPYESITSWYTYTINKAGREPSMEDWQTFFKEKLSFWKKFMQKWVLSTQGDNRFYYAEYQRLLSHHEKEFSQILEFMGHENLSFEFNHWAKKKNLIGFVYYSEEDLDFAEKTCKEIFEVVGIKSLLVNPFSSAGGLDIVDELSRENQEKTGGLIPLSKVLIIDALQRAQKQSIQPGKNSVLHFSIEILLELAFERQEIIRWLMGKERNLLHENQSLLGNHKENGNDLDINKRQVETNAQIKALTKDLALQKKKIHQIRSSLSWRLTRPARAILLFVTNNRAFWLRLRRKKMGPFC